MTNEEILAQVRGYCLREGLLTPGTPLRLAAAVSGGADSMALLLILRQLQPEFGYELSACHVNHSLRGEKADRDEAFVRDACARLGVPLRVFHAAELADEVGLPPEHAGEDWARRLRYACFARLCKEGIDAVATAHTANDQAELTRADTEAFCRAAGQPWMTDETNETDAYARNRVRRTALPALQSTNTAAVENLARFCEKAARADAYFYKKADALLSAAAQAAARAEHLPSGARTARADDQPVWRLEPLVAADELVLEAALHTLVAPERDAEEKYIRLLCGLVRCGSGAVQLTERVRFCAGNGLFWREEQPRAAAPETPETQPFCPEKQAEYLWPGAGKVTAKVFPANFEEKIQVVHKKDLKNRADYARITTLYTSLVLRSRLPGDRFRPAGRGVSKELRKWMNEAGVPARLRDTLPLLADGSNVLWVCGAGFAEGLAPDAESKWLLQLETDVELWEEQCHEHAR